MKLDTQTQKILHSLYKHKEYESLYLLAELMIGNIRKESTKDGTIEEIAKQSIRKDGRIKGIISFINRIKEIAEQYDDIQRTEEASNTG